MTMRLLQEPCRSQSFRRWGVPILIFLLAFLPRAIYPVSRPMQWYDRAIHFTDALLARDWAATYQSYHPGVTTMWLSGIGLKLFAWQRGVSSGQLLGVAPAKPGTIDDAVAAGVVPLAFVIALCIALSYVLLRRIAGQKVAFVGSFLLALDPFHIAYSKVLHLNALLATFMFVSVLLLFTYFYRAKWPDLVWSGAFAGLAFLTKSPSLFLIPYAVLLVGAYRLAALGPGAEEGERGQGWGRRLRGFIHVLLVWGGMAGVVFVLLWPAMWVEPLDVVRQVVNWTFFHVDTVHENPVFFNGEVIYGDPGLPYYLATILWKMTAVTLPLVCVALVSALPWFRRSGHAHRYLVWSLVVYVVCFTLQMGLGDWKQVSYMVPVFPALDVVAAFGLVHSAEWIGRIRRWQQWRWLPTTFIILALALQAGVVLSRHPYYGTHHNTLLGGSRVAQHVLLLQDQGEGLDLAAQYLNTLPRAGQSRAMVHPLGAELFERSFIGFTNTVRDPWINYRVYYVNQVVRHLGGKEWDEAWEADRRNTPLWSVAFDGVTYVWIYGAPPEEPAAGGPEYEANYRLGEHIRLKRIRLSDQTLVPGDSLTVVLIWESDGEVKENYTVFCHLLSADGELVAQRDGPPLYGVRLTPSWRAGEIIEDSREVFLDGDLAPGEYELSVGMYDAETMERLAAYDAAGHRLHEDRIVVGSLLYPLEVAE
jgi:hypothetical protein